MLKSATNKIDNMKTNLQPAYEAKKYEDQIYKKWEKAKAFTAKIDKKKKPFTIALPPPNATGTLHLGTARSIYRRASLPSQLSGECSVRQQRGTRWDAPNGIESAISVRDA